MAGNRHPKALMAVLAVTLLKTVSAVPALVPRQDVSNPFAPIDPQNWVNPDNMTWSDFVEPPNTDWSDPGRKGYSRNFKIAMVTVDYPDSPFVVTLPAQSDIFGNPQPLASGLKREDVPKFYLDLLNTPNELNQNHTLHEYWMGDSYGKYGVDLTVFGPYRMPSLSYQYGIDDEEGGFNEGGCPAGPPCSVDLRTDALGAWRNDVGNTTADSYELAFILSAGQDESSTWQEFGEMKFASPDDVPEAFGPPANSSFPGNSSSANWAKTRYVEWTSWASASTIWPNAGSGSSTQGESSGMATFAHELSHLLGIGDNYNNPFSIPPRRAYTGPFSMLDRGSFNGPGGPHTRWQIPPVAGASMGSLHTMRDKHQIGLIDSTPILQISRSALSTSGPIVAELTARSVDPGTGLMGFNISFGTAGDRSPACNISLDAFCDGGKYNNYNVEVVDRMGADSFCPDSGVMISKTKNADRAQPFQWVIDANPQDAHVVDFYYPNGTARYWSVGDYRQLVDALFHAGTNSGSEFEYTDGANGVKFYVLERRRDEVGVLKYTVGVASTATNTTSNAKYGVAVSESTVQDGYCTFELTNTGSAGPSNATASHPQDLTRYLGSDIYRVEAQVDTPGWKVGVLNTLAHAKFGECADVKVAVMREMNGTSYGTGVATVTLKVTSESDGRVKGTATCKV
jgi:M6 family metalloprotease-like protein